MLLVEETLTADVVRRVVGGGILAVRVVGYHPPGLCEELSARMLEKLDSCSKRYQRIYHSNVRAFTETVGDRAAQEDYLASSAVAMAALRHLCHPDMSPIDRLRCELDEIWPAGASLLRVDERPLVFGMLRVWQNGAQALPHLDILGEAAPEVAEARTFTEQLGVNIYLRVPPGNNDDGAVELWDFGVFDIDRIRHGIDSTYGYRRELLAEPAVVVRPEVGDLLLLRSTRVHAVRPTSVGQRVTLSGFVGHVSAAAPLRLWS
ncbi:MAG: hypothetical protein ACRDT0_23620 [Pseudonocardiaceae bacterium]